LSEEFSDDVALMIGAASLPRENGTLVFTAPWEGRALALAIVLVERLGVSWTSSAIGWSRASPTILTVPTTRVGPRAGTAGSRLSVGQRRGAARRHANRAAIAVAPPGIGHTAVQMSGDLIDAGRYEKSRSTAP